MWPYRFHRFARTDAVGVLIGSRDAPKAPHWGAFGALMAIAHVGR